MQRNPEIFNILFVALIVRIFVLLIGHYYFPLPDSTADAEKYESMAWKLGQEGFFNVINRFEGPDARFITWFIAIPYSLLGRSVMLAQSKFNFLELDVFTLAGSLQKYGIKTLLKVAWTIALFPSLILYSVLVMREVYMVFYFNCHTHGITDWTKK